MIPARVAKELHRSRTWTSDWLARYRKEGINGLENRPRSGRPSKLPKEVALKVRKKLKEGKQGWTTQQVNEMIVKEGNVHYHQIYIYGFYKDSRPVVTITGSHRNFCMFGAISLEGKQLFRQFEKFDEDTFYEFLKQIHYKFPKCYLFLDKAPQHYKSHKIKKLL